MANYTAQQLVALWTKNGGAASIANVMAAIALAESGGNPNSNNYTDNGGKQTSWGLWQISNGTHNMPVPNMDDPNVNAQQAVAKLASQGLLAWGTYHSGAYLKFLVGGVATGGGGGSSTATVSCSVSCASTASCTSASCVAPLIITGPGDESGGVFPGTTFGPAITIAPNANVVPAGPTNGIVSSSAVNGFGNIALSDITINGNNMSVDVMAAISDVIVERNIAAASTVTLQMTDPFREILRSGVFQYNDALLLDGLLFTMAEMTKTGDQLQVIFEASGVAFLRLQRGATATTNTVDITGFAEQLVQAIPGLGFVGEPTPLSAPIAVARGTSTNPNEDSWTCLVRIAATAGWRVFESANVIYFGSDPFWFSFPSVATLEEPIAPAPPQQAILNIDFDYDVGAPFGNITCTGIANLWQYPPASVVTLANMGPADGNWLVSDMQRDLFSPTMTLTLQVPVTPAEFLYPTGGSIGIITSG